MLRPPWAPSRAGEYVDAIILMAHHFIVAMFRQKFDKLSVPPKSVVKFVESTIRMSPARCCIGGSHGKQLNSLFPAAVNGCGRLGSTRWRASTCTVLSSLFVNA